MHHTDFVLLKAGGLLSLLHCPQSRVIWVKCLIKVWGGGESSSSFVKYAVSSGSFTPSKCFDYSGSLSHFVGVEDHSAKRSYGAGKSELGEQRSRASKLKALSGMMSVHSEVSQTRDLLLYLRYTFGKSSLKQPPWFPVM